MAKLRRSEVLAAIGTMERLLQSNNEILGRVGAGWTLDANWKDAFKDVLRVLHSLVKVECPKVVD